MDSASQVSSNVLHRPDESVSPLSITEQMQLGKTKVNKDPGSTVDNSKALVPTKASSLVSKASKAFSSVSKASKASSSISKASKASSTAKSESSEASKSSKAIVLASAPTYEDASQVSKTSKASLRARSATAKAGALAVIPENEVASEVSRASSTKSSSVLKASSAKSGSSRALVQSKRARKASPLVNEIQPEDLDEMYSVSYHEREPIADLPNREELIARIMQKNPHMEYDEASMVITNHLVSASSAGSQASRATSANREDSAAKSGLSKLKALVDSSEVGIGAKSTVSKASSSKSSALNVASDVSKARTSARAAASELALIPRGDSTVSTASSTASKGLKLPDTGMLASLANAGGTLSSDTQSADLLQVAEMKKRRELQRANAIVNFSSSRKSHNSQVQRNRMAELELARQDLPDSKTLSQLQQLGLHDVRMKDLSRHIHGDELSVIQRAEAAEADKRSSQVVSALKDREAAERNRLREKRGDIAKEERRRKAEKDIETLKEYERMDHQQTMEKVEGFARWVEATTPDSVPIPRRSGLELSNERNYHNPHTGAHGRSQMSIGRGCKGDGGDGDCRRCGLDPSSIHGGSAVMEASLEEAVRF